MRADAGTFRYVYICVRVSEWVSVWHSADIQTKSCLNKKDRRDGISSVQKEKFILLIETRFMLFCLYMGCPVTRQLKIFCVRNLIIRVVGENWCRLILWEIHVLAVFFENFTSHTHMPFEIWNCISRWRATNYCAIYINLYFIINLFNAWKWVFIFVVRYTDRVIPAL